MEEEQGREKRGMGKEEEERRIKGGKERALGEGKGGGGGPRGGSGGRRGEELTFLSAGKFAFIRSLHL